MVELGEIEQGPRQAGNCEGGFMPCREVNVLRVNEFVQPMAAEGEDVPENNAPEKASEFRPAWSHASLPGYFDQQINHAGCKQ